MYRIKTHLPNEKFWPSENDTIKTSCSKDVWFRSKCGRDKTNAADGRFVNDSDCCISLRSTLRTVFVNKSIIFFTVITFLILFGTGIISVLTLAKKYEDTKRTVARHQAEQAYFWIDSEIEKCIVPLRAIEQFIQQLNDFDQLPHLVDQTPILEGDFVRRNVTEVCDDPAYIEKFNEIASEIKNDAMMSGVLVNLQLSPASIICLIYPLVNTEDFPPGISMDGSGVLGLDLFNDPRNRGPAINGVKTYTLQVTGPITLIQGTSPIVKEAFIVRQPIFKEDFPMNVTFDGQQYENFWGYATVLLNWEALKDKAGLNKLFADKNMEFVLNRTIPSFDAETNDTISKEFTTAKSPNSYLLNERNSISVDGNLMNGAWIITVGFATGFIAPWNIWCSILVLLGSLAISLLIMMILVSKTEQRKLLYRMMPHHVIKSLRKGDTVIEHYDLGTIFCSDIVGFTNLCGSINPVDVMSMLNEMFGEFDKLALKYQICKIDTIGDAYICIGGGPDQSNGKEGAERVACFAIEAREVVRNITERNGMSIQIRAGIASGPIIACVIGNTIPKYTLFGSTLSMANFMESTSEVMKIQCSAITCNLLKDSVEFDIDLKKRVRSNPSRENRKRVHTWWLNTKRPPELKKSQLHENDSRFSSQECIDEVEDIEMNKIIPRSLLMRKSMQFGSYKSRGEEIETTNDIIHNNSVKDCNTKCVESNDDKQLLIASTRRATQRRNNIVETAAEDHKNGVPEEQTKRNCISDYKFMFWSSLAIDTNENEYGTSIGYFCEKIRCTKSIFKDLKHLLEVITEKPQMLIVTLFFFFIMLGIGIYVILMFCSIEDNQITRDITWKAETFSHRLVSELEKYVVPLYTLKHFVGFLDIFDALPSLLADTPPASHRNVSDICNYDSNITGTFNNIASSIMRSFDIEFINSSTSKVMSNNACNDVFLNLQLLPYGITCLIFPTVGISNMNDITFDYTAEIGNDLMENSHTCDDTKDCIASKKVNFKGPHQLKQDNEVFMRKVIHARLPIFKPGLNHDLQNRNLSKSFWGFSTVLLNWQAIEDQIGFSSFFNGTEYQIIHTGNLATDSTHIHEVVIAESENFYLQQKHRKSPTVVKTSFGTLTITVGSNPHHGSWDNWCILLVTFFSFLATALLATTMVTKYEQNELLVRMMPRSVIHSLKKGKTVAEKYDNDTVFFSQIVGFEQISRALKPSVVMKLLNKIFDGMDQLVLKHNIQKVDTIGDMYIAIGYGVGTVPLSDQESAEKTALFAIDTLEFVKKFNMNHKTKLTIRIGLSSGPVVAGVIGITLPKYTIFGDTVNVASRMQSTSQIMRIQCSASTFQLLSNSMNYNFNLEERRDGDNSVGVNCKGKGIMLTWWINSAVVACSGGLNNVYNNTDRTSDL